MSTVKSEVKMKLEKYLKKQGISIREFSRMTKISASGICRYISGQRTPTLKTIKKISSATNGEVTTEDFI